MCHKSDSTKSCTAVARPRPSHQGFSWMGSLIPESFASHHRTRLKRRKVFVWPSLHQVAYYTVLRPCSQNTRPLSTTLLFGTSFPARCLWAYRLPGTEPIASVHLGQQKFLRHSGPSSPASSSRLQSRDYRRE